MKTSFKTMMIFASALALTTVCATAEDADMHVSNAEAMKAVTNKVQPVYPAMARQLKLEGQVEVEAHISEDGSVDSVKPLTGNAVLMGAAVTALKKWKFAPFTEGGKPVKAVAPVQFSFKM